MKTLFKKFYLFALTFLTLGVNNFAVNNVAYVTGNVDLGPTIPTPGVLEIDTCANTVTNTVTTTRLSAGIAISLDQKLLFVTHDDNPGSVSVIDIATGAIIASTSVDPFPLGIAITPDGAYAYVATEGGPIIAGTVSQISTSFPYLPVTTVTNPPNLSINRPYGVAITPNGNYVFVTDNTPSGVVNVIPVGSTTVSAYIFVGDNPKGIAISPTAPNYAYVANSLSNDVSVIQTSFPFLEIVRISTGIGNGPTGVAVSPDGAFVYVTNNGDNTISVIQTSTNTVVDVIPNVGSAPLNIAITSNGLYAYVTNNTDPGSVTVINTSTRKVVDTIPAGSFPFGIALTPYTCPSPPPVPTTLSSPKNFRGIQKKNDIGVEYSLFNQLTWSAGSSTDVAGYSIYRNGIKIATVGPPPRLD